MRLRHIEVFHAVYTTGSITAAAKLLNVSQPSVSKVLAHAEQQLGFALFDRQKGKLLRTQEAERLIHHVSQVYENISELSRVAENLRDSDTGRIRMAMTPALGMDLVPSAIASYLVQHPETSFEVETLHYRQVARALSELRVDIGMVFDPPAAPGIAIERIATGEFVVLTHDSMDFGKRDSLTLEDLNGLPFINLNTRSPLGRLLGKHIDSSDIKFRSVAKVETYQMAKSLVAHGAGVAIVDAITAGSTGHDSVRTWRLEPQLQFDIAILHIEDAPLSILTRRFVEHLKSVVNTFLEPTAST